MVKDPTPPFVPLALPERAAPLFSDVFHPLNPADDQQVPLRDTRSAHLDLGAAIMGDKTVLQAAARHAWICSCVVQRSCHYNVPLWRSFDPFLSYDHPALYGVELQTPCMAPREWNWRIKDLPQPVSLLRLACVERQARTVHWDIKVWKQQAASRQDRS